MVKKQLKKYLADKLCESTTKSHSTICNGTDSIIKLLSDGNPSYKLDKEQLLADLDNLSDIFKRLASEIR